MARRLLVDGNNVMGSRPDGWWRDRHDAMQRVVNALDDRAERTGEDIEVIFDGRERDLQATRVRVAFAPHADDAIAARAYDDPDGLTVVTSDRELRRRVDAAGAGTVGARSVGRDPTGPRDDPRGPDDRDGPDDPDVPA